MSILVVGFILFCAVVFLLLVINFFAKVITARRIEATDKNIDACIEVIGDLKKEIGELRLQLVQSDEQIAQLKTDQQMRSELVDKQMAYFAEDLNQVTIDLESLLLDDVNFGQSDLVLNEFKELQIEKENLLVKIENLRQQMESLKTTSNKEHRQMLKTELNQQMTQMKMVIMNYQQKEKEFHLKMINENE